MRAFGTTITRLRLDSYRSYFWPLCQICYTSWANWANVLFDLSAFMGTALRSINNLGSRKTWFAQLEAAARRATSAKCGAMAHAPTRVSPRHLRTPLGDCSKNLTELTSKLSLFDETALLIYPNRSKAVEQYVELSRESVPINNPQDKCLEPLVCVSLCNAYSNYRFSQGGCHNFPRVFGEGKAAASCARTQRVYLRRPTMTPNPDQMSNLHLHLCLNPPQRLLCPTEGSGVSPGADRQTVQQ